MQTQKDRAKSNWKKSLCTLIAGRHSSRILSVSAIIVFLTLWEIISGRFVDPAFISSPTRIARAFAVEFSNPIIFKHLRISATEFGLGFSLAIFIGIPLGVLMGWYRFFEAVFDPFISLFYSTPRVALISLIVIWFGIGMGSKIAMVFLSSIIPIIANTFVGVKTMDIQLVNMARSFSVTDRQMFFTIALPSSVPSILTGLRMGVGQAIIGVFVGEFYASTSGVGYLIASAGNTFQTDRVFVGVIILSVSALFLIGIIRSLEKFFEGWKTSANT